MPTPCPERILLSDTTKSYMELAESTWHFGVTNSTTCVTVLQVEKSPVVIKTGVSKGDAEAMKKQLEAGGQDRVVLLCGWRWGFFCGPGAGSRDCCAFVCLLSSSKQGVFVITWNDNMRGIVQNE
jgi:hypothetical protein